MEDKYQWRLVDLFWSRLLIDPYFIRKTTPFLKMYRPSLGSLHKEFCSQPMKYISVLSLCFWVNITLKQELMVHFLETIFICGLIRIWCNGDFLQQQISVFWIDSKYPTVSIYMAIISNVTLCNIAVTDNSWSSIEVSNMTHMNYLVEKSLHCRFRFSSVFRLK